MRWTLVVPGALLPSPVAADVLAGASIPWLGRVLAKAQAPPPVDLGTRGAAHLAWLWRQFGGRGDPVTAPYALRALAADAEVAAQCWHIDPVHFALAREHVLVSTLDEAPPDEVETEVLARHLREALAEIVPGAAPALHVIGEHWLLTLAQPWSLRVTPLEAAAGQAAHVHWPEGPDAALWRRLLTEVQMRWHGEALNERREARGRPAVNALWLHGGGPWAPLPIRAFAAVVGDDPILRGWALASGLDAEVLHREGEVPPARGDVVSSRNNLLTAAQSEAWGLWLQRLADLEQSLQLLHEACFAAGFDELALVLGGRQSVRVVRLRRSDAWRVWRRSPLAPVFAEAT